MKLLVALSCAVFARVFAEELKAWTPWLVKRLIQFAVRRLPKSLSERCEEEWLSHANETPGEIGKLLHAVGIIAAAYKMGFSERLSRQSAKGRPGPLRYYGFFLSTIFPILSVFHLVGWPVTVLVLSRDVTVLVTCGLLYATGVMRFFPTSWLGRANTLAKNLTVLAALLGEVAAAGWIHEIKDFGIYMTVALTLASSVHYINRLVIDLRHAPVGINPSQ